MLYLLTLAPNNFHLFESFLLLQPNVSLFNLLEAGTSFVMIFF